MCLSSNLDILFKKVGSNFQIKDRTVFFEPRGPWKILAGIRFGGILGGTPIHASPFGDSIFGGNSELTFLRSDTRLGSNFLRDETAVIKTNLLAYARRLMVTPRTKYAPRTSGASPPDGRSTVRRTPSTEPLLIRIRAERSWVEWKRPNLQKYP